MQPFTVHTGLAVFTGTEDRPHALVALTRGTDANLAYVFTLSPKRADPVPGPRPAPELTRRQGLADADHLAVLHAIWTGSRTGRT